VNGQQLKAEGQARSLWPCTDTTRGDFLAIVEAIPVGQFVSINTTRDQLDAACIPDKMRGALWGAAIAEGLLEPLTHYIDAEMGTVPVLVPSTGPSAHRSHVRLYQRIPKEAA